MVQSVDSLGFRKAVIDILLHVEAVHEDESRRSVTLEQLLLKRVAVLAIVYNDFTVGCGSQPLVVWLKEGNIE